MTANSTLASSARRALRAAAHHLDPVVMVGQHGVTAAVLHEIDLALSAHALIKVRVQSDERETREAFLTEICAKLGCESVQHLGKILVLWRNKDGEGADDADAELDAAAIGATKTGRGPRAKLASERTAERAARPVQGGRGGALPPGERYRRGEIAPPPRREGWAPKDRRGVARAGGMGGGSDEFPQGRRDGYGAGRGTSAPRGRPTGGGYGDGAAPRGTGGGAGYGRSDRTGRTGESGARGGYSGGNSDRGWGDNRAGGQGGYGRGNDSGAARSRWGDRRDASGDTSSGDGAAGRGYGGKGGQSGYGGNDRQPPRGGGYGGGGAGGSGGSSGWGNRDAVTGKPRGFSGGGNAGGGGAAPRSRRRLG